MKDNFTNTDSMDVMSVMSMLDKQPDAVYQAEKAAAHGKYILSLAKNLYEREFNKHYLSESAGKTVKDKEAYALGMVSQSRSNELEAFYMVIDSDSGQGTVNGNLTIEECLRLIELRSSELFAKYHLEQNKLDVLRQKASLLKEMINSNV